MYRFTVGGDEGQGVTLERDLGGAHRSVRIDQSESVTTARRYREHFERRVRHETGIGILR